jgi:hypothetical protein
MNLLKKAGLALALGATAIATATPAEAQYRGGWHGGRGGWHGGRGDAVGAAVAGGILGLAVGTAIASDRYRGGYYGPGYYGPGYGYPAPYYYNDYRYRPYYPACFTERRWDPYWGRPTFVRVCR